MALAKGERRLRIRKRIRKTIKGSADKPRLSVYRSNKEIYSQLINDVESKTIVAASSIEKDINNEGNKVDIAKTVGIKLAEKAKAIGIELCSFDRGGYLYHGRVKSLAEGAREGGLKF